MRTNNRIIYEMNVTETAKAEDGLKAKTIRDNCVCFISCVNDPKQYAICRAFIDALEVPDGFEIEFLAIQGAASMCAGYNEAMRRTDAHYKIYLHQDVYLLDRTFLTRILTEFRNHHRVGMIGLAGSQNVPTNGLWWDHDVLFGRAFDNMIGWRMTELSQSAPAIGLDLAEIVDGIVMATQVDVPWREDLFTGWHFYDASQSMEFRRAGHQVSVLRQADWMYLHHCGPTVLDPVYFQFRDVFLKEYLP